MNTPKRNKWLVYALTGMMLGILLFPLSSMAQGVIYRPIPYRIQDKWGFSDYDGNIVIPAQYDDVEDFTRSNFDALDYFSGMIPTAKVYKNGYEGYIDTNGVELIAPDKYSSVSEPALIMYLIEEAEDYEEDIPENMGMLMVEINGKYGLISNDKFQVEPEFDTFKLIKPNETAKHRRECIIVGRKGDKWYRIRINHPIELYKAEIPEFGEFTPLEIPPVNEGWEIARNLSQPYGLNLKSMGLDSVGGPIHLLIRRPKGEYGMKVYGLVFRVYRNGKIGLSSKASLLQGILDLPPIYDSLLSFNYSIETEKFKQDTSNIYMTLLVEKDGAIGVVDFQGNIIIPFRMKDIQFVDCYSHRTLSYTLEGELGVYFAPSVSVISSPEYLEVDDQCYMDDKSLVKVKTKEGWGFVNSHGFEYWE